MNVPSGYTALDLIGFTDRGSYSPSANYVKNDLVHSGGKVWLCLIDDTTNITPAECVNWRTWIDEVAYLSGLVDTTITNPANGQILRYDGTLGKWVNANVDSSPTQNSTNLVQSGGVYTALSAKADASGLGTAAAKDSTNTVTQNSSDLVESGAVYTALSGKADASSLGTAAAKDSTNAVTQNSTDLVESGAVYSEVSALNSALTNVESDIAPIEDGTNYSTSYTKGAQFIRDGLLYKVTASSVNSSTAINTGSGGNAERADDITTQMGHNTRRGGAGNNIVISPSKSPSDYISIAASYSSSDGVTFGFQEQIDNGIYEFSIKAIKTLQVKWDNSLGMLLIVITQTNEKYYVPLTFSNS